MTPKELKALAKTMREIGITHLKTNDVELSLTADAPLKAGKQTQPEVNHKEIKNRVDDLSSIMSLGDEELIERLFPIPSNETVF